MNEPLQTTPLHQWHASHGGRLVDFAGWSMPVQYGSIVAEHNATRTAVTLFDVSHMGRLRFTGPRAGEFLERLLTRRVADMKPGQVRYGLVTREDGGILDDILVYLLPSGPSVADGPTEPHHLMVVNASNREKIVAWIERQLDDLQLRDSVTCEDLTHSLAMIAVQGPRALELVAKFTDLDPTSLGYYHAAAAQIGPAGAQAPGVVSRTGYTGEDGVELLVPAELAVPLWEAFVAAGAAPAGLAARDTLRLEAAMPLYGHELSESINPLEAGVGFAVNLDDASGDPRQFPGRDSIAAVKAVGLERARVGLKLTGRRVPREHYTVHETPDGPAIGEVTSGTFSPTLEAPIAMAYVPRGLSQPGAKVFVDLRGTRQEAEVVPLPFYKRPKK